MANFSETFSNVYLVTKQGNNYFLQNDGSGLNQVNPAATNITITDSNQDISTHDFSSTIQGNSVTFQFISNAGDTTFGEGFIAQDLTNGNYYYFTNDVFTGSNTLDGRFLSLESGTTDICFMPGTLVRTVLGEQPVEQLKIGDRLVTSDGREISVRWIGRQTVSRLFANELRLPIRVRANALDDNVPSRDLLISPDHALLVDGVLIHAGALVNNASIVRESNVPITFTYYHVEVDDHSLIIAENTPAETFIDNVDRRAFDNWSEYVALYPEGKTVAEMPYPRAKSYRQVPRAIRERLSARSAASQEQKPSAA